MTSANTATPYAATSPVDPVNVISIDDDGECPNVGVVVGWVDEETCLVEWNGARARAVPMDELMRWR